MSPEELDKWIDDHSDDFTPSAKYRRYMREVACGKPRVWQFALVDRAIDCNQIKDTMHVVLHDDTAQH